MTSITKSNVERQEMRHPPPWKAALIAGIWEVTTDRNDPSDEYDVNEDADEETVRLEAAAPELLAACEEMREFILSQQTKPGETPYDILVRARNAIDKAKGLDGAVKT